MNLASSLFPLLCWIFYSFLVDRIDRFRPSLSALMNLQRCRWVANAVHRDTPLDAILSSNLMSSVSFFASTTVLLVLALFTVFGQLPALTDALISVRLGLSGTAIQHQLIVMLIMFLMAFLSFTLALRQFNHFCIMLGAADHTEQSNQEEIVAIAALNTLGARHFNQGIRAYYFSIAMLIWFVSPIAAIGTTLLIVMFLIHREYFSYARTIVAKLKNP